MSNKKAMANMWWIIIGALAAIFVLVILLVMFGKGTDKFNVGLFDCVNKGGTCVEGEDDKMTARKVCERDYDGTLAVTFSCDKGGSCCVKGAS